MLPVVAGAAVFLATALALLGLLGSRGAMSDSERRVLALRRRDAATGPAQQPVFRRPASSVPFLARYLTESPWAEKAARELEQGAVRLRVGEYLLLRLVFAALGFVLPALIFRLSPIGLAAGIGIGAVGFMLPAFYVRARRQRRIDAINKQLPEFLSLVANSLRAGFAFLQSVETASRQIGPPIADELKIMLADAALGSSTEDALRELGARTGSYELEMVVTAILIQRMTGGNLSELLDNVASTMRDREQVRGEIRTFTAQQRLTGNILAVYPALLGALMFALQPHVWSSLLTEYAGQVMLGIAVVLQVLGFFLIRRILDIEY